MIYPTLAFLVSLACLLTVPTKLNSVENWVSCLILACMGVVLWPLYVVAAARYLVARWGAHRAAQEGAQKAAQAPEPSNPCPRPPPGWRCTRGAGHDGPCAAVPIDWPRRSGSTH